MFKKTSATTGRKRLILNSFTQRNTLFQNVVQNHPLTKDQNYPYAKAHQKKFHEKISGEDA
jgi:hypothetical protein